MAEFYDSEPIDDGQIGGGRVWGGYDGESLIVVYGPSAFGAQQMPNGQTELRLSRAAVDRFLAGVPKEDATASSSSTDTPPASSSSTDTPPASSGYGGITFGAPPNG